MTETLLRGRDRATRPGRRVVLRASRSRMLFDRVSAALSDRAVSVLNAAAFAALAAALAILVLF